MLKKILSSKIFKYSIVAVCLLIVIYIILSLITFNNLAGKAKGILAKELSESSDIYTATHVKNYFLSYENVYYDIDRGLFSSTVYLSGTINMSKDSKSYEVPFRAKVKIGIFSNKTSSVYINGRWLSVCNDSVITKVVII